MKTKEWRALIGKLRKNFPIENKIEIRRYPCKKHAGTTTFDGNKYRIRINSNQSISEQTDTLVHEFAHVLAIDAAYSHEWSWKMMYYGLKNYIIRRAK